MYKDNAVGNVVAETERDLVFMITARLSDLSMPLKGEVRPVQSARQPIAKSGKFVRRAYSRRALDCEKDDGVTWGLFLMYLFRFRNTNRSENMRPFCVNRNRNSNPVLVYKPGQSWFTLILYMLVYRSGNQTTRRKSLCETTTNKWVGSFLFFF